MTASPIARIVPTELQLPSCTPSAVSSEPSTLDDVLRKPVKRAAADGTRNVVFYAETPFEGRLIGWSFHTPRWMAILLRNPPRGLGRVVLHAAFMIAFPEDR
jgi:hypothetical protein